MDISIDWAKLFSTIRYTGDTGIAEPTDPYKEKLYSAICHGDAKGLRSLIQLNPELHSTEPDLLHRACQGDQRTCTQVQPILWFH